MFPTRGVLNSEEFLRRDADITRNRGAGYDSLYGVENLMDSETYYQGAIASASASLISSLTREEHEDQVDLVRASLDDTSLRAVVDEEVESARVSQDVTSLRAVVDEEVDSARVSQDDIPLGEEFDEEVKPARISIDDTPLCEVFDEEVEPPRVSIDYTSVCKVADEEIEPAPLSTVRNTPRKVAAADISKAPTMRVSFEAIDSAATFEDLEMDRIGIIDTSPKNHVHEKEHSFSVSYGGVQKLFVSQEDPCVNSLLPRGDDSDDGMDNIDDDAVLTGSMTETPNRSVQGEGAMLMSSESASLLHMHSFSNSLASSSAPPAAPILPAHSSSCSSTQAIENKSNVRPGVIVVEASNDLTKVQLKERYARFRAKMEREEAQRRISRKAEAQNTSKQADIIPQPRLKSTPKRPNSVVNQTRDMQKGKKVAKHATIDNSKIVINAIKFVCLARESPSQIKALKAIDRHKGSHLILLLRKM